MVSLRQAHFPTRTICFTALLTRLFLFSASLAIAGDSIPAADDPIELQRTWDSNAIYLNLPAQSIDVSWVPDPKARNEIFAKIPTDAKLPAILFLHGCDGIFSEGSFLKVLAAHGYAVFEPNSFARKYRPVVCVPKDLNDPVVTWSAEATLAEIAYNLQQLRTLPWIDPSQIFLMGHSRGGEFTAWYSGDGIRARVAMGATCWRGIRGESPLLAIFSKHDSAVADWRPDRCNAADTYMEIEGTTHAVFTILEVRDEIINWLNQFAGIP